MARKGWSPAPIDAGHRGGSAGTRLCLIPALAIVVPPAAAAPAAADPFVGPAFRSDDEQPGMYTSVACSPTRALCMAVWVGRDHVMRYRMVSERGEVSGSSVALAEGYAPDVACNAASDEFLIVWAHTHSPGDADTMAARIRGSGSGSPAYISTTTSSNSETRPEVAAAGEHGFLVVFSEWTSAFRVMGQVVSAGGMGDDLVGGTFAIGPPSSYLWYHDVAYSPAIDAYAVASPGLGSLQVQLVSPAGTLTGAARPVATREVPALAGSVTQQRRPSLLAYEVTAGVSRLVQASFIGADGAPLAAPLPLSSSSLAKPMATRGLEAYAVACSQEEADANVRLRLVPPDGTMKPAARASADGCDTMGSDGVEPAPDSGATCSLPVCASAWGGNYRGTCDRVLATDSPSSVSTDSAASPLGAANSGNLNTIIHPSGEIARCSGIRFENRRMQPQARFVFGAQGGGAEEPPVGLVCRWGWTDDGAFDGGSDVGPRRQHAYSQPGSHTVRLQVRDPSGPIGEATRRLLVTSAPATVTPTPPAGQQPTCRPSLSEACEEERE